jgi:hypothetical protein
VILSRWFLQNHKAVDGTAPGGSQREATMATIEREHVRALPRWPLHGDGISRTFHFDDFGAATRFVGRITLDAARSPVASPPSRCAAIA